MNQSAERAVVLRSAEGGTGGRARGFVRKLPAKRKQEATRSLKILKTQKEWTKEKILSPGKR